jgi:NAD kinase
MCITAINPKALSFRPLILPSSAVVTLKVPKLAPKCNYRVSIDGGLKFTLESEDSLIITGGDSPVKFVTRACKNTVYNWIKKLNDSFSCFL